MSKAPDEFSPPSQEIFEEWNYANIERLGMMCEDRVPTEEQAARAAFEADRHIESLYPVECYRGWVKPKL